MGLVNNFKNFSHKFVGPAAEDVIQCDADKTIMLLSLDICNVVDTGVQCDVILYDDSAADSIYLLKSAPVPVGGTLQVISKQKHVLEPNDKIQIVSNIQDSVHVLGAAMELFTS